MTEASPPALPAEWHQPPVEFSLAPFWFWNDELHEAEIARQLDEFQAHGVDAFVLHPRVGLPRHQGWMTSGGDGLLDRMRFAIEQAESRGMWVILYDEGMYPSGSASGQVVAENPLYQCRGLVRIDLTDAVPGSVQQGVRIGADGRVALSASQTLVAEVDYHGRRYAIVDRPIDSVIRGLHFLDENTADSGAGDPPEETPPAADLLNPEAVAAFIRHSYQRYFDAFGASFGTVIQAIFTDEPDLLGRSREPYHIMPGTTGILAHVNAFLGDDFTPHLPALWDEDAPPHLLRDYLRAVEHRFEQTYYAQLYDWCQQHHIALTGHPAEPDATRHLRYFHIPGQDIVWRFIEPGKPTALEGRQSTQAKAASSVMLHAGLRRNANEFCGAYGHELTFDEMRWLAHWLLIRGCNLLIPHAFYYSVRGPRRDERPPDVGLHSGWWDERFSAFALASRRLCWLNTDSEHLCSVAILGEHHHLPWRAAKVCFQHQFDFNYVDTDDLLAASISDGQMQVGPQRYTVLIVDSPHTDFSASVQTKLDALGDHISVMDWSDDPADGLNRLYNSMTPLLRMNTPSPDLRVRQVRKSGFEWVMLFNEGTAPLTVGLQIDPAEQWHQINPYTDEHSPFSGMLQLAAYELRVLFRAVSSLSAG